MVRRGGFAIDAVVPAVALFVQVVMERERRGAVQKQDRSDSCEHIFDVASARPWHVSLQLHVDDRHDESALVRVGSDMLKLGV